MLVRKQELLRKLELVLERKRLVLVRSNRSCGGTNRPMHSTKKRSSKQLRPKQVQNDAFETLPKTETKLSQRVSTPWLKTPRWAAYRTTNRPMLTRTV
jgi:hypothetical protein